MGERLIRGVRGATTVPFNNADKIITHTRELIKEMALANQIMPEQVATVFISVTSDIDADFPAKALRQIEGWKFVPVMCMKEIEVPGSLARCIRVMMTINTELGQKEVQHIYHYEAEKLRPDLRR